MKTLYDIKKGDKVVRYLSSSKIPMELIATEITPEIIKCGAWQFDRKTGAEIDELLGWGPNGTGSFIRAI